MGRGKPRSRSMLLHSSVYTKDEELGKRDDDFRPKRDRSMTQRLNPLRWRKRRIFGILSAIVILYIFVKNIPDDLGPAHLRVVPVGYQQPGTSKETTTTSTRPAQTSVAIVRNDLEPKGSPPQADDIYNDAVGKQYYNGIIKYYRLAGTLTQVSTANKHEQNRNVLFAASNMKSLANLIPLACEMAGEEHNWVHMAIMSRVDLSIEDVKKMNSVDSKQCPILFHDARPDYTEYSSDARHEAAVSGGLSHIREHMGPHAIIIDDESLEDATFSRAIKRRAKETFTTLIEIPAGGYDNFRFISKLDYSSLGNWNVPTIEVVVQTQKESVGSFIRLLRTLAAADYSGLRLPKLTINLATNIQPGLRSFLRDFRWPPRYEPATTKVDTVTVRHQVQSAQMSSEQAALRVVESFYPANKDHHVLLLSPQVELSPQYMLYLQYTILRYKYAVVSRTRGREELLGISLDIPSFQLGGKPFAVPHGVAEDETLFLHNVPSSSSLLVFGDKWSIFHNYLTHRITASHSGKAQKQEKLLPETEPAWAEYLLELIRARGWNVLYPNRGFATVHNELAQVPEEYTKEETHPKVTESSDLEEPFLVASDAPVVRQHQEEQLSNPLTPLHDVLPQEGYLEDLVDLPYVSHLGERVKWDEIEDARIDYLHEFRRTVGGCTDAEATRPRVLQEDKADDLFCLPSVDMLFDTAAEEKA